MVHGQVTSRQYALHLWALRGLLERVEAPLFEADQPQLRSVMSCMTAKIPLLERDLARFQPLSVPVLLAEAVALPWEPSTWCRALGRLYVFEGSSLGGAILRPRLAKTLGLREPEMAYYSSLGDRSRWVAFGGSVDRVLVTRGQQEEAIAGALEAFRRVGAAYDRVFSSEGR